MQIFACLVTYSTYCHHVLYNVRSYKVPSTRELHLMMHKEVSMQKDFEKSVQVQLKIMDRAR